MVPEPFEVDLEFGKIHQIPDKTLRSGIWSKTHKKTGFDQIPDRVFGGPIWNLIIWNFGYESGLC